MINKKDLELKLLLRESHIQQLNLKVKELELKVEQLNEELDRKRNECKHWYDNYIELLRGEDDE